MKLSDYVIGFLIQKQVKHAFMLVGGACAHLVDSLYQKRPAIEPVCMQHEQAVAFAAEAYARMTGNVGVAMATSGPGATNFVTGIGSAFFDSIPCLYITGQVNTYDYSGDSPQRQKGFQETDIVSIVKPITKYAAFVDDPQSIRFHLEKGFYLAKEGRPGPVLLDLPMDIQRSEIEPEALKGFDKENVDGSVDLDELISKAASLISQAERPVILAGGGVRLSGAVGALKELVDNRHIPVVVNYSGKDAFPNDHTSFAGFVGNYGHRAGNFTLANADLILVLGARLDTRTTGSNPDTFVREATIIQVEIDPNEINQRVQVDLPVMSDVKCFLDRLNLTLQNASKSDVEPWLSRVQSYKSQYPWLPKEHKTVSDRVDPYRFMQVLSDALETSAVVVADTGQVRVWGQQMLNIQDQQRFFSSVGMAPMGYGLPAAIGAAFANKSQRVICLAGDGGFQLNIQELQTIGHHQLPITFFIMNNGAYGMIKQFQDLYFEGRTFGTGEGYSVPDFARVAQAYSILASTVWDNENLEKEIQTAFAFDGPFLCQLMLSDETRVIPKVRVNCPIEDGEPLLDRDEFLSNMVVAPYEDKETDV